MEEEGNITSKLLKSNVLLYLCIQGPWLGVTTMKNTQGSQNSHFHGAWLIRHMGNICERQQNNMKSRGKMEGGSINKVYNI